MVGHCDYTHSRINLVILPLAIIVTAGCASTEPIRLDFPDRLIVSPDWIDVEVGLCLFRPVRGGDHQLHVHISFPRSRLYFLRDEDVAGVGWNAQYEWRVIIRDRSGLQVGGGVYRGEVAVRGDEQPSDPAVMVRAFEQFPVQPGSYRVEVVVSDRNSVRSGRNTGDLEVLLMRSGEPGLSGLEILEPEGVSPGVTTGGPDAYPPEHAGEVIASSSVPEDAHSVGILYEAYRIPDGSRVVCRLLDAAGEEVRSRQRTLPAGSRLTVRDTISTGGLPEDHYTIELSLEGAGAAALKTGRRIKVCRPLLAWGEDPGVTAAQLSLFTDGETVERFKHLPEGGRRGFLDSLWNALDPTPGTERNEVQEEFTRRLRYADERWRAGGRRGWDVDIGRVYIAYGEPDEIADERMTVPPEGPLDATREIVVRKWIYREPPVVFVFSYERDQGWVLSLEESTSIPPEIPETLNN